MDDYEALRDLAQRLPGRSHWPEGDTYSEVTVLATDRDLVALVLREGNDKPIASLLWAANSPTAPLDLAPAIDALDQALVTNLPGKIAEIKPWRQLVHAFINWGISLGARQSMLWLSDIENWVARKLYESVGYRAKGSVELTLRTCTGLASASAPATSRLSLTELALTGR